MRRRRVISPIANKARISFQELSKDKPSELKKFYGMSEHGLQQELAKHCGDAKQIEQREVYKEVYGWGTNKKE